MPPTSGDHQMISISYECSYTPPFIARDTLAVHHQHLEAKVALGRQAGMQEDSAVECSTEPSNINYIGSYIPSALHLKRICSAKLHVLRKGRHGGQREQRSLAPSLDLAPKNDNFWTSVKAYYFVRTRYWRDCMHQIYWQLCACLHELDGEARSTAI